MTLYMVLCDSGGYGSEQGADLQAVVHVARDVGLTAVEVACACGVGQRWLGGSCGV